MSVMVIVGTQNGSWERQETGVGDKDKLFCTIKKN